MMSKFVKTNGYLYSAYISLFQTLVANVWSHCKTIQCYYEHCYQLFFIYRIDFLLLLLSLTLFELCLLFIWLNQLIYNVNFSECFMNVSWWNVVNYNLTYVSNSLDLPCFAESKLVESSERNMLLLLLFCILQSSFYETWLYIGAPWKYVKTHFSITWLLQIASRKQCDTSAGDDELISPTDEVEKWQQPPLETEIIDVYRSIDTKRAQKQMNKGMAEYNFGQGNHKTSTKKAKTNTLTLETEPYSLSHQDTDTQPSGDDSGIMQAVKQSQLPVKQSVKKTSTDTDDFNQLSLQKACIIFNDKLYTKLSYLTSLLCVPKVLIAKSCSSSEDEMSNLDVTDRREWFISNKNQMGHILFTSDKRFSGSICYPLPKENAQAKRMRCGNMFKMFHGLRSYAVEKVLTSEGIYVHSQLFHCNIINLEALLVGEKHKCYKDKHYIYCFMPEMDIDFRRLLLSNACGSLKDIKMQLAVQDWQLVMLNVKHVLRSVLKALHYMHSQGYTHGGMDLGNVLIKMVCSCGKEDLLYCTCCQQNFAVKLAEFSSSAASYDSLYSTTIDIWSFGCFLLDGFVGKCRTTENTFEDLPFSVSVKKSQCQNVQVQFNELQKYYSDMPGLCDLVQKCLQVDPNWRPTAEELSQSEFLE